MHRVQTAQEEEKSHKDLRDSEVRPGIRDTEVKCRIVESYT